MFVLHEAEQNTDPPTKVAIERRGTIQNLLRKGRSLLEGTLRLSSKNYVSSRTPVFLSPFNFPADSIEQRRHLPCCRTVQGLLRMEIAGIEVRVTVFQQNMVNSNSIAAFISFHLWLGLVRMEQQVYPIEFAYS